MKAISLWEPWASAMALGLKMNETRSWPTAYRGDLAICASKRKMDAEALEIWESFVARKGYEEPQYGKLLCVVELFNCMQTEQFEMNGGYWVLTELECRLGKYEPGRFAWMTRDPRIPVIKIPIVGRQGLWNLDADTIERIKASGVVL